LEARKNYEKVKQQRDQAMKECEEIKIKLTPVIEHHRCIEQPRTTYILSKRIGEQGNAQEKI
jgi:hypothetical protein